MDIGPFDYILFSCESFYSILIFVQVECFNVLRTKPLIKYHRDLIIILSEPFFSVSAYVDKRYFISVFTLNMCM